MMDFSGSAGADTGGGTLPKGLLVFAILNVRGVKSSASGGGYLDCELTIKEGQPFAGRKIWEMVGDPMNSGNSEAYRKMGNIAISRILETGRGASPTNPEAYKISGYEQLSTLTVAIKVGIEPGTDGHDDKNRVAEWLTPNPASSAFKLFERLLKGDHNLPTAQPGNGGAPAATAPVSSGFGNAGFGNQGTGGPAPSSGFGSQAGNGQAPAAASGFGAGTAANTQPPMGDAAASPSNAGQTPGWLAQAGQQG